MACIMFQGTASNVGKSMIATGICRIISDDGYRVAPFKSQNMSRNSSFDRYGGEMGIAQVAQARAARIEPLASMNPILLKPSDNHMTDLIFNGKYIRSLRAREYMKIKKDLRPGLEAIYKDLESSVDIVVLEGAGSPVEININQIDLSNMEMAKIADSPVILVADIDRGGVFASIVGTLELMTKSDRSRVKGVIINKFRGDEDSFQDGIRMLEDIIKIPVLGLVPYADIYIDEEDGASGKSRDNVDRFISSLEKSLGDGSNHIISRIKAENEFRLSQGLDIMNDSELGEFVRECEYDRLAKLLRDKLDIRAIYNIIFRREKV